MAETVSTPGEAIAMIIDALEALSPDDRKKVIRLAAQWCNEKPGRKAKSPKQATLAGVAE